MEVITSLVPYQVDDFPCQRFDVVAIIDVLRATTTLLFAVKAEAKRIIPVATVDEAFEIKYELTSENVLLCGERGGKIVPGFDLGNSPLEYTPERVKGKTLIYASTNGSVLMRRAESLSDKIFLVSLRNIMAAADRIVSAAPKRMLIACAGKEGMSSLEDTYAAGFLIDKLLKFNIRYPKKAGVHIHWQELYVFPPPPRYLIKHINQNETIRTTRKPYQHPFAVCEHVKKRYSPANFPLDYRS